MGHPFWMVIMDSRDEKRARKLTQHAHKINKSIIHVWIPTCPKSDYHVCFSNFQIFL